MSSNDVINDISLLDISMNNLFLKTNKGYSVKENLEWSFFNGNNLGRQDAFCKTIEESFNNKNNSPIYNGNKNLILVNLLFFSYIQNLKVDLKSISICKTAFYIKKKRSVSQFCPIDVKKKRRLENPLGFKSKFLLLVGFRYREKFLIGPMSLGNHYLLISKSKINEVKTCRNYAIQKRNLDTLSVIYNRYLYHMRRERDLNPR
jgi:hypothetical protein